ncbi:hypothetical protein IMCC14465_10150 [alpha proteobacterium IMCC14465]|uniref:Fatty acid desaturase domain-containing protein n=1 Tax=alpha proteobacterium IMCC14465 TaxID=1220535 RepID=J9DZT4_9PROT|nr:hypothetical protein IMCC14465_10150 [alpha proteobacterium IMCC14465]
MSGGKARRFRRYFKTRCSGKTTIASNEFFGHITGILTGTPYHVWQSSHLAHHAVLGRDDQRGVGDIGTITIDEYKNAGLYDTLFYRLERNWMIRFTCAPALFFLFYYRLPLPEIRRAAHIKSVFICNIGFIGSIATMILLIGLKPFLIIYAPAVIIATAMGAWLTYVQHQFENTIWIKPPAWNFQDTALYGSSYYDLPAFLHWFTGNIGIHHVHHLCARIPFYRLPQILKDYPALKEINRLTLTDSLKTIRLNIWDDDKKSWFLSARLACNIYLKGCCLIMNWLVACAKLIMNKISPMLSPNSPLEHHADVFSDGKKWQALLKPYETPNAYRSLAEIALTIGLYAALWLIAVQLIPFGWWATLPISILMAGMLVRIFILFHDCTHGALFKSPVANEYAGHFVGILSGTPYHVWQTTHLRHHAAIGRYERRGIGDIRVLTINEYKNAKWFLKFTYRLERSWLMRFTIAPVVYFMVYLRLPFYELYRVSHWKSIIICNIGLIGFIAAGVMLCGLQAFLIIFTPAIFIATALGAWLTYVQHQFETTVWVKAPNWRIYNAAFYASTYYDLPAVLQWFTGNIGIHHVHHLNARIPFYRLPQVLKDYPALKEINPLNIKDSLKTVRLNIWDDDKNKLVSFRESGL